MMMMMFRILRLVYSVVLLIPAGVVGMRSTKMALMMMMIMKMMIMKMMIMKVTIKKMMIMKMIMTLMMMMRTVYSAVLLIPAGVVANPLPGGTWDTQGPSCIGFLFISIQVYTSVYFSIQVYTSVYIFIS